MPCPVTAKGPAARGIRRRRSRRRPGPARRPCPGPAPGARETSGATTGLLLAYVRRQGGGRGASTEVLRRAGVPLTAEQLEAPGALEQLRHPDPAVRRRDRGARRPADACSGSGARRCPSRLATRPWSCSSARIGSPRQVFRQLPRAVAKFSTTSTMEIVESGATSATIRFTLHDGLPALAAGLRLRARPASAPSPPSSACPRPRRCTTSASPTATPPASTTLTWEQRRRLPWRRRDGGRRPGPGAHRAAQPAAHPAVGGHRPRRQRRPRHGAAADRRAAPPRRSSRPPTCSPSVVPPCGGAPLVHSAGLPAADVPRHGRRPARRRRPRPATPSSSTSSPRAGVPRPAGRDLPPGDGALGDERSMLAAYAGHAAAALDLLDGAGRRPAPEADRAGALLSLAHELAGGRRRRRRSAASSPRRCRRVVGCSRASVLLWDPAEGILRTPGLGRPGRRARPACS